MQSVSIPETVTEIQEAAFSGCSSLSSLTIPDSVSSIGRYAFSNCTALKEITLPESVSVIEEYAFYECASLSSVVLPKQITYIDDAVFSGCSQLRSIDLPDQITSIGRFSFYLCTSLMDVTLPSSLVSIDYYGFADCESLTEIKLPASVAFIGESAFARCSSLSGIAIPEGVTAIEKHAFLECRNLSELSLPSTLKSIGSNAFYGCSALTGVSLPENLRTICEYAFSGCTSIRRLVIPEGITAIETGAFGDCRSLYSLHLPADARIIKDYAFAGCDRLTSVTLPDSVVSIGEFAFSSASSLKRIWIPESVTSIGDNAFYEFSPSLLICGVADSVAEEYAAANHIPFQAADFSVFSLSGYIQTPSGSPISGVLVCAIDGQSDDVFASVLSDQYGFWSITDLPSADYAVYFYHEDYTFSNPVMNPQAGDKPVTGTAIGETSGVSVSFAMQQYGTPVSSIIAGTSVDFILDAPGVSQVRLVVDDITYEAYALDASGHASFSRIFTQGGIRRVAFQPMEADSQAYALPCEAQTLQVTDAYGSINVERLDQPVFNAIPDQLINHSFTISWQTVPGAGLYHVYLYADDCVCWESTTEDSYVTVEGGLAAEGTYTVVLAASGYGYSQSEVSTMLNVLPTTEALEIANAAALTPSVLGGSCHVEVISAYPGLYKKLVVTAPDGIQTETSATPGNVIYLEYHQTGTYTIRAIASMQEDFSADTALYSTQPMSIAVDSNPQIDSISHDGETGDYGLHYTDEAMFLIVRNTFVADSVAVYEGDSLLCVGERSQYDNYWYSFDCTIPANTLTAGKHELTLRAYFDDEEMTSPIAEVKYIVYMIEGVNDSTQYYLSRSATLLTGSPEKSSGIIQPAGTPAVKVGVYGALSYVRIGNTHGFVSVDLVTAWTDEGNDIWIDPELCMVYADGALAHQSSIRAGTSPVWYAPVQANHTFRLYTEEALDHLSLNIFFVDMNGEQTVVTDSAQTTFADGYVDVFLPAHTSGGKSGTYQFYYAAGNNLPNQLIILTVYEPVEDVRFIYPKSEYLELRDCVYVTPLRIYGVFSMEAVYYTYPVSLCGTLGDEWYFVHYVESGIDIYRWVPAILTLPEKNETITRVYLLVTDHLYNGKSSEQKTADKTLVLFKNLFSSYLSDPSNLYVDTEITAQEMDRLFRTIGFQTDFNDKTYLYLLGHGKDDQDNSKLITHLDSEQNLVGIGYRKLTQEFFSRLNGEAVIFVQSCYGGWIVQWAQEVLDPERISIVTSCAKNEGSIFAKTFPTPFGSDLLESCTSSSPAADANHDGLITLKELFDSNVWRYLWLMTEYQEEHTQIFGNEDNLVFSVPE